MKLCLLSVPLAPLKPFSKIDNNCTCSLLPLFLLFAAVLHGSYRCERFLYTIGGRPHAFQLGHSDSQRPPAFFVPNSPVLLLLFTDPHYFSRRQLRWTQTSPPATIQTECRRFEGPIQVFCPITRPRQVRFYRTHVTLLEKPLPMMPCAMSSTSPPLSKGWPIPSFHGKCEKLNQQWSSNSLVLDLQSYLNLHRPQPNTSAGSVNNLTGPLMCQSKIFSDLIFTIKDANKQAVDERSGPQQRGRSGELLTSNNRSPTTMRIKANAGIGTKIKYLAPIAAATFPLEGSRTIQTIEWVSTTLAPTPQKTCQRYRRKNQETHDCLHQMRSHGTFSARLPRPVSTFELKQPAHARGGCAVDPNHLIKEPAFFNSATDNRCVFVISKVCSLQDRAVCDTGASVSWLAKSFWSNFLTTFRTSFNQPIADFRPQNKLKYLFRA